MQRHRPSFLDSRRLKLLLFGGKGGVGKTTCAVATALELAASRPRASFLLLSTDPAHSLADCLAGTPPPANLEVLELDAGESLDRFRAAHGPTLRDIAAAGTFLDDEDIGRFLNLTLPGLDELMAFLRISEWVDGGRYAAIIVDTAPSGHTLRLLAMPNLLRKWLAMLDALLAKRRYMRRVFSRCARADQNDRFVADWCEAVGRMSSLLNDPEACEFVPVTIPEALSVRETVQLLEELERLAIPASNLIINQARPSGQCPACSAAHSREWEAIRELLSIHGAMAVWLVSLFDHELQGVERLQSFWQAALSLSEVRWGVRHAPPVPRHPPDHVIALPGPPVQLILFAGKGGVGKTTLACASAIRLAQEFLGKRVLLVSTDPAHSLSTCLGIEVGGEPTRVWRGLSAMEINGPAQFEALKASYAGDVERFLASISTRFDLAFDRVVLEKLVDVAPPGLDEVMGLASILDLLSCRQYDFLVLDSAPTGHFLRLMELPSLIDEWLKAFFDVLLKYAEVIELPGFAARLVALSKNVKSFRGLLTDRTRAILYAVSIAKQMALEETRDLLRACGTLGITPRAIFLNLLTPPGDCHLCVELRRREREQVQRFRDAFPEQHHVLVYRQGPLTGFGRLEEFSRTLFGSSIDLHDQEPAGMYAAN